MNLAKKQFELSKILANGKSILLHAEAKNYEKAEDLLSENACIIEEINLIDFDIRQTSDKICAIFGKRSSSFEKITKNLGSSTQVPMLLASINDILKNISIVQDSIIQFYHKESAKIKKDADEISESLKIKKILKL